MKKKRVEIVRSLENLIYVSESIGVYDYKGIVSALEKIEKTIEEFREIVKYAENGVIRELEVQGIDENRGKDFEFAFRSYWAKEAGKIIVRVSPLCLGDRDKQIRTGKLIEIHKRFYGEEIKEVLEKIKKLMEAVRFALQEARNWLDEEVELEEFGKPPALTEEDLIKFLKGEKELNSGLGWLEIENKLRR